MSEQRPLRFRVWNPAMGMYRLADTIGIGDGDEGTIKGELFCSDDWEDGAIIEQYTGLNDANGTPIFEGDIVRFVDFPWNTDHFIVEFKCCAFKLHSVQHPRSNYSIREGRATIIGNIHETPELLTGATP